MTYVGKGYGWPRDATKYWRDVKTSTHCQALCKEKYLKDNLWNGCSYYTTGKFCEAEKNVKGFRFYNNYNFWRFGENLFLF